jgi:hypothetical protein
VVRESASGSPVAALTLVDCILITSMSSGATHVGDRPLRYLVIDLAYANPFRP